MLRFIYQKLKRALHWIGKNKVEVIDHILLVYTVFVTMCPQMLPDKRYRVGIVIIYLILELILAYFRTTESGPNVLLKFKHKRFTEDSKSGLIKFDKNRLNEMILFVYDLEEEMDRIVIVNRNQKKNRQKRH